MALGSVLALGVLLGMRHATDADHVIAVTTLVSRATSTRRALSIGALWGLGHTLTVLLVGGAIIGFELVIPPHLGLLLEFLVALMLIALGVLNLRSRHKHQHHHPNDQAEPAPARSPIGSLFVGMVHGLAGSAALALLVLTTIQEPLWAIVYLLIFGAGSILGMVVLTALMALPLWMASRRFGSFEQTLTRVTGVVSVVFGLFLVYQIGFVDGLFGPDPSWSAK